MDIKISALALLVILAVCEAKLTPAQRLTALRNEMATRGYNAAIIPTEDEHQSEYVAEYDLRREWLTGFTGSAGTAVVTKDKALLWTDSRYYAQARNELKDTEWILMEASESSTPGINAWLVSELNDGDKVGQSSKFVSINTWTGRESGLKEKHITLENTDPDLVDSIWPSDERAPKPKSDIKIHDLKFAGKTWKQKVEDVQKRLNSESVDMFVVTALDEVAWLFNIRASDIPYNPMVFAYAIIHKESNAQHEFYIDMERVDQKLRDHLNGAEIRDYTSITNDISAYSEMDKKIWISPMSSYAIYGSVTNKDNMLMKSSPIRSMKARKTDIEMENNRRCHLRDSVARVRHMYWLETEMAKGERITEWSSAERLEEFQKEDDLFHMLSFDSISAVGANAAIIHYSIDREKDVALEKSKIYLLDAGAQYDDCTTDITRTLHFGQPTYKERYAYTRVLQGSIDLANVVFPPNVYARELDAEARIALWRTGLDYGHGTGHGIGYYLSVHENPPSTGGGTYDETLEKGMIMSDEPGYYEDGSFGIRLETDIEVVNAKTPYSFRGRQYLKFEPLTFVPFERKLIDECLLTNEQVDWMNKYYQEIDEKVAPKLTSRQEKDFLMEKTKRFKYSYQLPFCSQYDPDATDNSSASKITFSFSVFITVLSAIYVQYFA